MMKLATTLQTMTTPDYKDWPTARHALKLAAPNGYRAVGLGGEGGILAEGALADVTLWDLSSLALLPRTDPLTLLVLGSRTQAPSAGAALSDSWVRGVRIIQGGDPVGIDLKLLRKAVASAQPAYKDPDSTDPSNHPITAKAEVEYRAAMGLDGQRTPDGVPDNLAHYEAGRVLYDAQLR